MTRYVNGRNSMRRLATAYHEAGHAAILLFLGREINTINIESDSTGSVTRRYRGPSVIALYLLANKQRKIRPDLVKFWLDEFCISDSGQIAEIEFNLVSDKELKNSAYLDQQHKMSLIPEFLQEQYVGAYFDCHVRPYEQAIFEQCRKTIRLPKVNMWVRVLAESLVRSPSIEGDEAIELIMANQAALTKQQDLFWVPPEDIFRRTIPERVPKQLTLSI